MDYGLRTQVNYDCIYNTYLENMIVGDSVEERAKLQMIIGFRRSMPITLKRIFGQEENPLYAMQFNASEIFQ